VQKPKLPQLVLIALLALMATTARATKVELLTVAGGTGQALGDTHGVSLTIGQPLSGRIVNATTGHTAIFGFWDMLSRTMIVSPVGDKPPVTRNQLLQNYPNPFNPSTRINFALTAETEVRIEVYDLQGRRVDTLLHEVRPAGFHTIAYQPRNLASGAYVILMRAGSFRATQRMMLIK